MTVQGVPEGVASPAVSALGPKTLHITWDAPSKPNGVVREYRLNQTGVGLIHTHTHGEMEHTVQGIKLLQCVFSSFTPLHKHLWATLYKQVKNTVCNGDFSNKLNCKLKLVKVSVSGQQYMIVVCSRHTLETILFIEYSLHIM